ncbi:MAG: tripartite tricarboxylate transporter substrate binding protein, partial [Synergistaceae bacterium]|nr:tripartite tricarboxylate transporter substrate binding protein [Synergistaceae bacterium]
IMKRFICAVLALALALCSCAAFAEWKPDKAVTMIVAYKAGSGTDTTARVLSEYATKTVGQTVVINNLEGGSGSIGWTALAKAKPDGYTLGFVNLPTLCSNIVEKLGDYKMEDFVPVCNHVNETALVLVSKNSKFNTLEELVAWGKENPNKLKASTNGRKASNHIGAELFAKSAGIKYKAIPFGGTADQLLALRQGAVDFSVAKEADIAAILSEVKVLGVFAESRMPAFPAAPTLGELGLYNKWYGSARAIVAPKGTPQDVIDFYAEAFKQAMEDKDYLAKANNAGITTLYMDQAATGKLLDDQYKFCTDEVTNLWK